MEDFSRLTPAEAAEKFNKVNNLLSDTCYLEEFFRATRHPEAEAQLNLVRHQLSRLYYPLARRAGYEVEEPPDRYELTPSGDYGIIPSVEEATMENEITVDQAVQVIRRDYYKDVMGVADDVIEFMTDTSNGLKDRDDVTRYLEETIDGHERVIYTFKARLGMLVTDNDEAYESEHGEAAPSVESAMFMAMLQDVREAISGRGYDLDSEYPGGETSQCEECSEEYFTDQGEAYEPSWDRNSTLEFCSKGCVSSWQGTHERECDQCGDAFDIEDSYARTYNDMHFCGETCQDDWKRESENEDE
jgi:hypothetical protein